MINLIEYRKRIELKRNTTLECVCGKYVRIGRVSLTSIVVMEKKFPYNYHTRNIWVKW